MPRLFIHISFLFFALTALSGVGLRLFPFFTNIPIPYDHVLHGHSHIAILGWTFLGTFLIFLIIYWRNIRQKTEAKLLVFILFMVTLLMFFAFLYQSYDVYSIILSVLHIFIEYWVITFIYRVIKSNNTVPKIASLFIHASLFSLFLSTLGPFSLGYISATGLKDSYWFDVAIYFYLHFQYNGWLFLSLIGLFIIILTKKKIAYNRGLLSSGFWIYILALLPNFFASILWVDGGEWLYNIAIVGTIGQWIGVLCIIASFISTNGQLLKREQPLTISLLFLIFIMLLLKSTMELGLIIPNLGTLVFETRSVIVGYLHFTLLGFVSLFILVQYLMTSTLSQTKFTTYTFLIFISGFLINELLLFTQGLVTWLDIGTIPGYLEGLLLASTLLLVGVTLLWFTFFKDNR